MRRRLRAESTKPRHRKAAAAKRPSRVGGDPTGAETSLLSLPPTHRQTRWAIAVGACQVAALALLAPFAKTQLAEINAFIPAFEGVISVTDLVTSVLLFSQFAIYRLRALLFLACGYLSSALMIIPHALTFPGAFSPTGLLGAGLQTTASLYWFWHLLFPMALLGYGLLGNEKSDPGPAEPSLLAVVVGSVALVLTLACGLTLLATAGNNYLPVLFADRVDFTPAARAAGASTMLLSASAVAVLWLRRRSLLDQWLMIVALAAILEMALGAIFVSGRFSLGFYAGRLFSLLTSTIVLVVLLAETARLYATVARSQEGKIRRLVDANIIGIFMWDFDGRILEANEAFLRIVGYELEDLVAGRIRWTDLTPPEWRERDSGLIQEHRATGILQPFEKEYFRKDGSRVPVLIGVATFEEGGNQGVAFVLDLTERKKAEDALRRDEAWLAQAQRLSHTGNWVYDATTMLYLFWSEEIYRIWGLDPLKGLPSREDMWQRIHPDDREGVWGQVQEALREKRDFFAEFRLLLPDGTVKYLEGNTHHEFSPLGALVETVSTHVDVTERKRAEQALRESEAKFRAAIDGIAGLVAIMAPSGELEAVNRPIIEYFGRTVEELKNWGTSDAVHPEDLPRVIESYKTSLATGTPFHQEQRLRRFDGEYRWFENRGAPIRDGSGCVTRWYCLLVDIEDRTRALERLQQLQSDFAHMNRVNVMGELAASLSHEITQPIASARNNARAAQNFLHRQTPDLREVDEALGCIVVDADRAGNIIDRIRDHIKKAPPRKALCDLNAAINEVVVLARSAIVQNGVSVQSRLAEGLSHIHGDRVQLQQVVLNLILNAVEAMGSSKAGARQLLISTEQDHNGILVAVCDSGPGIDPAHFERVFDAFYTTKPKGMGMGLSICRSIINAHGGRLWAEVNGPRGTVFQFTLPTAENNS